MKKIILLGASGSIGTSTIEVLRKHKNKFRLIGFSVYSKTSFIEPILQEFKYVKFVGVKSLKEIKPLISKYPKVTFLEDISKVASYKCDIVVNAIVGFAGLKPTISAIKANNNIALANKETLVVAGQLIKKLAKHYNVSITPIDSEHSAIFQCLEKENKPNKIILTASGGPFFRKSLQDLEKVTLDDALKHPTWQMGPKITIDSATMFNKAFEIIEAYYLFDVNVDQISVLIHPQSIVHSLVAFNDGSLKAHLAISDMKIPIAYALSYPLRLNDVTKQLQLDEVSNLEFYKPDLKRFKPLQLAYDVLEKKNIYPCVLNAANEEAVKLFLDKKIKFLDIIDIVEKTLKATKPISGTLTFKKIIEADKWARGYVRRMFDL